MRAEVMAMATKRAPCPPAPGPLEDYARQFDASFANLAQRRAFRDYLHGLLLPRERTKTLTGLDPVRRTPDTPGATHPAHGQEIPNR